MKCTINKEYTKLSQVQAVKNAIKDFKETFSENDLLRMYTENMGKDFYFHDGFYEILRVEADFFPMSDYTDDISTGLYIIIMGTTDFFKIHYYMDYVDGEWSFNNRDANTLTTFEMYEKKF